MCDNEVWVLLGLVLIISWTNAAIRTDDGTEIPSGPTLRCRKQVNDLSEASLDESDDPSSPHLAKNDSHIKYLTPEHARKRNSHKKHHRHHHRGSQRAGNNLTSMRAGHDYDTEALGQTQPVWVTNEEEERGIDIEVDDKSHSKRKSEKTKWPKLVGRGSHRYKKAKNDRGTTRRQSPLFLMQKPEKEQNTGKKEDLSYFTLINPPDMSPYSMKDEMLQMAKKFTGINISVEVIGKTIEYNDIVLVKTSDPLAKSRSRFRADDNKYIDEAPEKKIIFIVHSLNVQGMDVIPCLAKPPDVEKLLAMYFSHLENFDIFIIPMANPDGYAHLRAHSPWSKNRSPQSACPGVNVDRNFDVGWTNGHGSNITSCSHLYPGPSPFSEPESRAVRDVMHQYGHKIIAYIHVHGGMDTSSYYKGDTVLYPRGFSDAVVDDDRYVDLRFEIDEMMRNTSFQVVNVGMQTLHSWYGKVVGTSVDYASEIYGIPYAFEFVMQVYEPRFNYADSPDYPTMALNEIWRRVIDTVFNKIWAKTSIACAGDGCVH